MADLAIGSIGLAAQLFVSIYQTYQFVSTAQSLSEESPLIFWKLRIQQIRFESWGRFWGIEKGALDTALQQAGLQNDVCGILAEMEKLLRDTKKLSSKYGLEAIASDSPKEHEEPTTDKDKRQFRKGPSLTNKFKFAFKDKAKFEQLINDLTSFNDGLFSLLRLAEYNAINVVMQSETLRSADRITDCKNLLSLSATEENRAEQQPPYNAQFYHDLYLGASSKLRQIYQTYSVTEAGFPVGISAATPSETTSAQRPLESLSEYLRSSPTSTRVLAKFAAPVASETSATPTTVVVEWKVMDIDNPQFRLISARVNSLANLLSASSPKPTDFRVLDCLGFVKDNDPDHPRFGYIFGLPERATAKAPTSLFDVLSRGPQGLLPDLGSRFELARRLAASVVRLHDCDWVHGCLSSTNIVFFWEQAPSRIAHDSPSETLAQLENRFSQLLKSTGTSGALIDSISITSPYLMGFTYSRPSDPAESTLEWTSSTSPSVDNPHSLYRHPSTFLSSSTTADHNNDAGIGSLSRRQRYDLFSLGLILLEVGLWEQLSAMWKPKYSQSPVDFIRKLLRAYVPRLEHRMGTIYSGVVRSLLGGDDEWNGTEWKQGVLEERDWAEVISRLGLCHA